MAPGHEVMRMFLLQAMMVVALLSGGMGLALLGTIKVPLARRLQIDESRVGGLVSLFGFVLIPVILTAGFLTDLVGRQVVLTAGALLLGASLLGLARARSYRAALAAVLLLSTGWSLQANVGNVLAPLAFPGGLTSATNLSNVIFGLGAFLTPLGVMALVRKTSLALALSALGLFCCLPALLALGIDFSALVPATTSAAEAGSAASMSDLLTVPIVWLCSLAFFCYGPLEASVSAWATSYLSEHGVAEPVAARLLSGFWLAFMLSRLLTALGLPAGREAILVLVLSVASAGVLIGIVISRSRRAAMVLVVAAGLVFGPIFPTLLAILLGQTPATLHGRVVGLFFAVGGVGWTLIPLLIGAYASRTSVQRSFRIAAATAGGLILFAVLLALG
jgi:fucose permease